MYHHQTRQHDYCRLQDYYYFAHDCASFFPFSVQRQFPCHAWIFQSNKTNILKNKIQVKLNLKENDDITLIMSSSVSWQYLVLCRICFNARSTKLQKYYSSRINFKTTCLPLNGVLFILVHEYSDRLAEFIFGQDAQMLRFQKVGN